MKALCINLSRRPDRKKMFEDAIGRLIPGDCLDFISGVDGSTMWILEDFEGCHGDLACRASHAIAYMECLKLQENVLIFEDDAVTNDDFNWDQIVKDSDHFSGKEVLFYRAAKNPKGVPADFGNWFNHKRSMGQLQTHAYMVTPKSAAILLERILRLPCPVNMMQMSVDHPLFKMGHEGVIDVKNHSFFCIWQRPRKATGSDLQWSWPEARGRKPFRPIDS